MLSFPPVLYINKVKIFYRSDMKDKVSFFTISYFGKKKFCCLNFMKFSPSKTNDSKITNTSLHNKQT